MQVLSACTCPRSFPAAAHSARRKSWIAQNLRTVCGAGVDCTAVLNFNTSLLSLCAVVTVVSNALLVQSKKHRIQVPVQTSRGDAWTKPVVEGTTACKACRGVGRIECPTCAGLGRINYPDKLVLPHGVFPVHCLSCMGTTRTACFKCLGTGQAMPRIGFRV